MDCKEVKRAIPLFLADELEGKELKEFVKHLKECSDCMEETTIQFLATEGLNRLEEGTTFDLDKELKDKLVSALRREELRQRFRFLLIGVEIISIIIIIFVFIYVFFV